MSERGWLRSFDAPILLPDRGELRTLRDAAERDALRWRSVTGALLPVVELLHARVSTDVFTRRNQGRSRKINHLEASCSQVMSTDYDHRAEIETAMTMAAAAMCELERIKWLRVALAWQDLARGQGLDRRIANETDAAVRPIAID